MARIPYVVRLLNVGVGVSVFKRMAASISPRHPEAVDWPLLMKRLYWAALRLVGRPDRVIDCGVSPAKAFFPEALMEFLKSPNVLGWDGTEGGLTRLLCGVVRLRFLTHLR